MYERRIGWEEFGVSCGCDAAKALQDRWGGGVEVFVGNTEDSAIADGAEVVPVALCDDTLEGNAIPCPAPGKEENVGLFGLGERGDVLGGGVGAGGAEELAACCVDEFGYPVLRVDEGLAPLFAVDDWARGGGGGGSGLVEGLVDLGDDSFSFWGGLDERGDETDVGVYVGQGVGREGEGGQAGFEDGGKGLEAIGDAGEDYVGFGG